MLDHPNWLHTLWHTWYALAPIPTEDFLFAQIDRNLPLAWLIGSTGLMHAVHKELIDDRTVMSVSDITLNQNVVFWDSYRCMESQVQWWELPSHIQSIPAHPLRSRYKGMFPIASSTRMASKSCKLNLGYVFFSPTNFHIFLQGHPTGGSQKKKGGS